MHDADSGPLPQQPIGEVRVRHPRDVWLAPADRPLRCGPGEGAHRFHDQLTWNDGGLRCDHRGRDGHPDCDRLVYFVGGNFTMGGSDRRIFIAVNVTLAELRHMREQHMTAQQAIEYLGIGLLP